MDPREPERRKRPKTWPKLWPNNASSSIARMGWILRYSTFRANPAKTGGLIFVSLILFPKLHFLYSASLKDTYFFEHIWLSKKITCEIKVHEDINMECSNPDHWIQHKILPVLDYKNSSVRQLF